MKNRFVSIFCALACVAAQAADWPPDFQAGGNGPAPYNNQIGAAGFRVMLNPEARLYKPAIPFYVTSDGIQRRGADEFGASLDLGGITCADAALQRYNIVETDWAHSVLAFPNNATLYLSRLTPALVVETDGSPITFFTGAKAPAPRMMANSNGIIPAEDFADIQLGDTPWLLVWFGKDAGFQSSRFPYTYNGKGWMPTQYVPVDCPILLVFPDPLAEVGLAARGGLGVNFENLANANLLEDGIARVAVLPLFGDIYPTVKQTEAWAAGLPEDVKAHCEKWAQYLAAVPLTARETYDFDEASDTITITGKIEFLKLRENGVKFAPLPPMAALARAYGFPMKVSGEVARTSALTAIGPCEGLENADSYAIEVPGLLKYVRQTRKVNPQQKEPEELDRVLNSEISKMTQAGHLAPWYPAVNVYGAGYRTYLFLHGTLTWGNPGETLFALGEALPLLDEEARSAALEYMERERNEYPPEGIPILRVEEGARRERWRIDEGEIREILLEHNDIIQGKSNYPANFFVKHGLIPPQNLYYLSEYERLTGAGDAVEIWADIRSILDPWFSRQDWASLGWFRWPNPVGMFDGFGGVVDANNFFSGLIGAVRIARLAKDAESEKLLLGQLARMAMLRYAMGSYGDYLYDNRFIVLPTATDITVDEYVDYCGAGAKNLWQKPEWQALHFAGSWTGRLISYDFKGKENDVRSIVKMNEFGVYFDEVFQQYAGRGLVGYRGMVAPELGRFLADFLPDRAREYVNRMAEHMPDWHVALSQTFIGAEFNYLPPEDSYTAFLAHAWILKDKPETLRRLLDVPWMERGDLYYIIKLSETIKAYRGWDWE